MDIWKWEAPDGSIHDVIGPVCPIKFVRGRALPIMGDDGPIVDMPYWQFDNDGREMPMTKLKTFRRDRLRRLVEAGRVVTVSTYSFDDTAGEHRTHNPMPVAMKPADWRDCKPGTCYMTKHDFTSKSGCCYTRPDSPEIVVLVVHSNSNYEFRILPASV